MASTTTTKTTIFLVAEWLPLSDGFKRYLLPSQASPVFRCCVVQEDGGLERKESPCSWEAFSKNKHKDGSVGWLTYQDLFQDRSCRILTKWKVLRVQATENWWDAGRRQTSYCCGKTALRTTSFNSVCVGLIRRQIRTLKSYAFVCINPVAHAWNTPQGDLFPNPQQTLLFQPWKVWVVYLSCLFKSSHQQLIGRIVVPGVHGSLC